jgi:hypothetical protein
MLNSRAAIVLGLGITLGLINNPVATAQDGSAVVAEVGNHKITADELQIVRTTLPKGRSSTRLRLLLFLVTLKSHQ